MTQPKMMLRMTNPERTLACILVLSYFITLTSSLRTEGNIFTRRYKMPKEPNYRQIEKKILDDVLSPEVYDPRIRPAGLNTTDGPSLVYVNVFVRSFSSIDDVKMEYSFQITLRQQWNDKRLRYGDKLEALGVEEGKIKYLTMTDASKVWMPDTFFRNEKIGRFHTILTPNLYVRVFPNGNVLYSIRVSLICSCGMYLALFPFDEQTCNLDVASYGWTKNDLIYIWKDKGALQFAANLSLPGGFKMANNTNKYCDVATATGEYSCLRVDLVFARELSFYIVTIYVPCFMIVVVSWFSFWLDYKAVPARVALGVTTLLAMSTTMASIQRSLPPVAYTKAVDVWSGACVFFVFSALLEYALVNYASRSDAQRAAKQKERKEKELELCAFNAEQIEDSHHTHSLDPLLRRMDGAQNIPLTSIIPSNNPTNRLKLWMQNYKFTAKKIDVISRVGFPSSFFFFSFLYWSYFLTRDPGQTK